MADHPLGRVENPYDARDGLHPFTAGLPDAGAARPAYRYWTMGPARLDQGQLGACVAFAGNNWKQSSPLRSAASNAQAVADYRACKLIDGIPDVEGTYDRALMKVFEAQGRLVRYLWAQSMSELVDWILLNGTVMVGTNWYSDMFNPGADGRLHIAGQVVGGHEYLIRGVNSKTRLAKIVNSWGPSWGLGGEAWISFVDLERLVFSEGGDACTAIEKAP